MSRRKPSPSDRSSRSPNSLHIETLEPRVMLAADLQTMPYEPVGILDPYQDQAVTSQQMIARAQEVPFVAGDLMVALQLPYSADSVQSEFYLHTMRWSELTGVPTQHTSTLMQVDRSDQMSFVLVQLEIGKADLFKSMTYMDAAPHVLWSSPNFYLEGDQQDFVPDDPDYGQQYTHPLVGSESAWDVTLGDPSIIVGITDDGVDLAHPDLSPNIWVNPGEIPGNGLDDDNNGYIDDVNGWDWANDTNDPSPNGGAHGTHVSGISAARTDNGIGVAGLSGHSTILPLQFYGGVNDWTAEIINNTFTYAADNGSHIVNTSYNINGWVGDPVFTAGMQYMYDNGVLHFNSAGNGSELNPARQAFEQTFLVVSTTETDTKSGFSNWGTGVDISAPGSNIYSTLPGNTYGNNSGTSMAAPNAAGAAALIWSAHTDWNRDQVVAQLLGTADNIDAQNPAYAGLMGAGRINVARALNETLAAPQVKSLSNVPSDGDVTTDLTIDQIGLSFSQVMDPASVNEGSHFELRNAGFDGIFGNADDDIFGLTMSGSYLLSTNNLTFDIDSGVLPFGEYQITVFSGGVVNPFGTALDGNGDGTAGDHFTSRFTITPPPPANVLPNGSLIYNQSFPGVILSAADTNQYGINLDAGQTLTVFVQGANSLVPTIDVFDPDEQQIESVVGAGTNVTTSVLNVETSGTYVLEIGSDAGSNGSYQLSWLLNSGIETEDIGGATNNSPTTAQAIDSTALELGDGQADRMAVIGSLPSGNGQPIVLDNFENGSLDSNWTTSSTATGRIQVTGQYGTGSGNFALLMDSSIDSSYSRNEAIWTVDLTGTVSPSLVFEHAQFDDEIDALPQTYTGSFDGDGVSISDDGNNWYRVFDPGVQAAAEWNLFSIDLVAAASAANMTLGDNFQIKFQQYDNFALATDGRGFDNVSINEPDSSGDWYSFQLDDGDLSTIAATNYQGAGVVLLELFDASGNSLGTGTAGTNVSSYISQFEDTTNNGVSDTYYAHVLGQDASYSLLVLRNAEFDLEPNDTLAPLDITDVQGALGFTSTFAETTGEPDDFLNGAILDNAIAGVVLSNVIGGTTVNAASAGFGAPTGSLVFSPGAGNSSGWSDDSNELRADFDNPSSFVSIDVGSDDSSDVGFLRAYDASGTLLEEVISNSVSIGGSETISISRPSADIAYIIASGLGTDITPLDRLVFAVDGSDDAYLVDGIAGEELRYDAFLPGEGPHWFDNGLDTPAGSDLRLELFDGVNSVATGINSISYEPSQSGLLKLVVSSAGGAGEYYLQLADDPAVVINPTASKFLDGLAASGQLLDGAVSDDVYYQLIPSATTNPSKQKIDLILQADYQGGSVNEFEFRMESAMQGGPQGDVIQTIEFWNTVDRVWDLVDQRAAATTDTVVQIAPTGDVSRYVHSSGDVTARVQWTSESFGDDPFFWSIDVDQFGWLIS